MTSVTNNDGKVDFEKLGLTKMDVEVLALHFYEGWSYREIAENYGTYKQLIANRINKCRKILQANAIPLPTQLKRPNSGERVKIVSIDPSHFDLFAYKQEIEDEEEDV